MSKNSELTGQIVDLLEPLESTDRQKIIKAALTLLGETHIPSATPKNAEESEDEEGIIELSKQAKVWMKQNGINTSDLEQVFHIEDGKASVIASTIPGKSLKIQTANAYILQGLSGFLISGDMKFDDESAKELCAKSGVFDSKNHATYLKGLGNKITGSKTSGWSLTSPGVKYGAELIKEIIKGDD